MSDKLSTFPDQLAPWFIMELMVEFSLELLKILDLIVHHCLLALQGSQFCLCLGGELSLDPFHKVLKLFDPVLFGFPYLLDRLIHFTYAFVQIPQP